MLIPCSIVRISIETPSISWGIMRRGHRTDQTTMQPPHGGLWTEWRKQWRWMLDPSWPSYHGKPGAIQPHAAQLKLYTKEMEPDVVCIQETWLRNWRLQHGGGVKSRQKRRRRGDDLHWREHLILWKNPHYSCFLPIYPSHPWILNTHRAHLNSYDVKYSCWK